MNDHLKKAELSSDIVSLISPGGLSRHRLQARLILVSVTMDKDFFSKD